ncbi:hypothetical protein BD779DRAFT_1511007 [Infundibulicybe gibba]|nr:hypothetical protein BD779DRAFT_1511007 [Infundibulicybe gibba]
MFRATFRPHLSILVPRTYPNPPFSFSPPHPTFRASWQNLRRQSTLPKIPSFREGVALTQHPQSFVDKIGRPRVRNQVLFFLLGSAVAFTYAAGRTNYETDVWIRKLGTAPSIWGTGTITSIDLKRAQNADMIKTLREWYAHIHGRLQDIPGVVRPWAAVAYVTVMQPYADASEGKRMCWKICLFNAAVWAAWKIRRLQGPMAVSFMHNPLSGLSFTLLTSMFSHRTFIHLLFNCLALESFGSGAYYYLTREQAKTSPPQLESTGAWHFLAFFISAGLFSGLVSHVVAAKFQYPRLIAQLSSASTIRKPTDTWAAAIASSSSRATSSSAPAVREILPSLGASGAVYAAVTLTALAFPESQVALFIPPSYPISIQWGVGGMVALDILGVLRGWRYFDHWAHLGGAAFGVAYYAYGPQFWNMMRRKMQVEEGAAK